jgi:hypothetical protein
LTLRHVFELAVDVGAPLLLHHWSNCFHGGDNDKAAARVYLFYISL